ncbi:hypothetical protein [Solibacillus sp. FSL W8-0372]|uniref:hypothetical protein n=1 Tax=Solibacillus sp. FSL W8-0372 TaxID=2921713 RepID=UPI0030D5A15E
MGLVGLANGKKGSDKDTHLTWLYRCLAVAHQSSEILLEKQAHVMVMSQKYAKHKKKLRIN